MAETQINGGPPPQTLRQLRQIRKEFEYEILPQIKAGMAFESKNRRKKRPPCRKSNNFNFSPFAMTLGNGDVQPFIRKSPAVGGAAIPVPQTGQLISVFVIAKITTDPPVYVLQKIQKKSARGFPGGGIEEGETILKTGAREWREESNRDPAKGVDITVYNPLCVGEFVLDRAVSGERGAVVLVEIPESEIVNIEAGGGAEEGEVVESVFFMTFDEVLEKVKARTILPNSVKIWDLYCNYLVNAP